MKTSLLFRSRAAVRCGVVLALLCMTFTQGHSQALQWEQTNGPYGGNVYSFTVIGTTVLASTQNGIFRSTDNGVNWTPVIIGTANLSVSSFAVSGTMLYASTNGGLYRSADNGISWTIANANSTSTPTNTSVFSLVVNGTTFFGIDYDPVRGIRHPNVLRSTNNGATWIQANAGLPASVYYINSLAVSGTTIFAGTNVGVFRSIDNGANWTSASTGLTDSFGVYVYQLIVSGTTLVALTNNGIFRSTNSGDSWVKFGPNIPNFIWSFTMSGTTMFAGTRRLNEVFGSTDKGVFRSIDNGVTWNPVNVGLTNMFVRSLAVSGNTILAGTDGGGICRSTDNGATWTQSTPNKPYIPVTAFAVNGTTLFAGAFECGVFRSTNNGTQWSSSSVGLPLDSNIALAANGTAIFVSELSGVFRSLDNGATWTRSDKGLEKAFVTTLATNGMTIFAGTYRQGVFRSTDNGATWAQVNLGTSNIGVFSFAVNGMNIFAGTGNGVFRSTDNGVNWSLIGTNNTGFVDKYVRLLGMNGTTLFAGTSNGIFRSSDFGTTWIAANTGLPNQANAQSFAISGTNIFVGIFGSGVFRSSDNGTTWTQESTGLSNTYVYTLAASGTNLFAGTDNGIFRAPLSGITAVQEQPSPSPILTQYPNPFTTQTTLEYDLPAPQHVRLALYSPLGQELMTLVDEWQQAGRHSVSADMSSFASGVYVARLQAGAVAQALLLRLVK